MRGHDQQQKLLKVEKKSQSAGEMWEDPWQLMLNLVIRGLFHVISIGPPNLSLLNAFHLLDLKGLSR